MEVRYRKIFLKELKKLKKQTIYRQIVELAFEILPAAETLSELGNVKAMTNYPGRYRVRIGDYRIGFAYDGKSVDMMRVLHRKSFYRYFP